MKTLKVTYTAQQQWNARFRSFLPIFMSSTSLQMVAMLVFGPSCDNFAGNPQYTMICSRFTLHTDMEPCRCLPETAWILRLCWSPSSSLYCCPSINELSEPVLGVVAVFLSVLREQYCHLVHGPFFWLGDGSSNWRMRRQQNLTYVIGHRRFWASGAREERLCSSFWSDSLFLQHIFC